VKRRHRQATFIEVSNGLVDTFCSPSPSTLTFIYESKDRKVRPKHDKPLVARATAKTKDDGEEEKKVKKLISLTRSSSVVFLLPLFVCHFFFCSKLSAFDEEENLIKQLLMAFLLRLIIVKKVLKLESK
jgi:hypothetical protein